MPAQHIDGPAVPVVVERHLDRRLPAALREELDHEVDEVGMRGIEKAVEAFAVPSNTDVEVSSEGHTGAFDVRERDPAQDAALDPAVLRSRDPGRCGHVRLTEPSPDPKSAERPADAEHVHLAMMRTAAYPPVAPAAANPLQEQEPRVVRCGRRIRH